METGVPLVLISGFYSKAYSLNGSKNIQDLTSDAGRNGGVRLPSCPSPCRICIRHRNGYVYCPRMRRRMQENPAGEVLKCSMCEAEGEHKKAVYLLRLKPK